MLRAFQLTQVYNIRERNANFKNGVFPAILNLLFEYPSREIRFPWSRLHLHITNNI